MSVTTLGMDNFDCTIMNTQEGQGDLNNAKNYAV